MFSSILKIMLDKVTRLFALATTLLSLYWPLVAVLSLYSLWWYGRTGSVTPLLVVGSVLALGILVHGFILAIRLLMGFVALIAVLGFLVAVSLPFVW